LTTILKIKIEHLFEKLGCTVYDNPLKVIISVFIFIGFLAFQIPSISIDTSSEALLHKNDPSLEKYNVFRDQFGRSELIIIGVLTDNVFEPAFLEKLNAFHKEIEIKVPYVREVTSLINMRYTQGKGDELIVEGFLEHWPESDLALHELKAVAMASPAFRNYVLSEDGRVTAVIIETEASYSDSGPDESHLTGFDDSSGVQDSALPEEATRYLGSKENREITAAIKKITGKYTASGFCLFPSGGPIIIDAFNQATMSDINRCIFLSLAAVAFFLAILFKRISGVILPVIIIIASLVSTIGLMAVFNVPIKITTTVIPAFLLSVGVADSVHILAIFYRHFQKHNNKKEAVSFSLGHSGLAIVMTSLTTAAGLLSFSLADLAAIAEIGYFAAAGVMLALIYTVTLLPAMLSLVSLKQSAKNRKKAPPFLDRVLNFIAGFAYSHPVSITVISLFLMAISAAFLFHLEFSHNIVKYFPKSSAERQNLAFIDNHLKGSISLEVVIDTNRENGMYEPEILNLVESVSSDLNKINTGDIFVGKVFSINDIVKEINQALHDNDKAAYSIPQDRETIAQELLLFENSGADDLERIVDSQFSKTRMTIKTPWVDAIICKEFISNIKKKLDQSFQNRADITITGLMALLSRAISAAIYSMAKSYTAAFIVITLMMILLLGNPKTGLISMIPNLFPVVFIMGVMGSLKIPLDLNTLMIGSIAIGLVVDDTVHFMYNFQRYYNQTGDARMAIQETLLGTGRAMLITTLVLSTGFFVLMAATLNHLVRFGLFTGITILLALLADFLLAPALMMLMTKRDERVILIG